MADRSVSSVIIDRVGEVDGIVTDRGITIRGVAGPSRTIAIKSSAAGSIGRDQ
jgi:hypothetical protein